MATNAINSTTTAELAGASSTRSPMGKEDFLKLLVAQLSHQDPLKPTDGAQFVAELAQFSNLEQMIGANAQLQSIAAASADSRDGQAFGLLGKTVTASTDAVEVDAFSAGALRFSLSAPAAVASITISDADGNVVRKIDGGSLPAGANTLSWDGVGDDGQRLPSGSYRMSVSAKSEAGGPVAASSEATGVVTSVVFVNGKAMLEIGGARTPLSTVVAVQ